MAKQRFILLLLAASAVATLGCASTPRPILSNTQLGTVIIYRNGVAYFERYAQPGEEEITLRVPAERVDDFLKSLSIVDEQSGDAMPVSYPTLESYDGYLEMTIKLPKGSGRLRITYVTESPAWKPSYRVVLAEEGKARLQGWAVVDNASGEDWEKVRVGVGSTSALSFRYDLHSVRLVERQTLSTGEQLAHAPPTGGSPYAVATKKVRVLGNIAGDDFSGLDKETTVAMGEDTTMTESAGAASGAMRHSKRGAGKVAEKRKRQSYDDRYFEQMRVQAGKHRIRIEGFARSDDSDRNQASLTRANRVKERLLALGVPAGQIDVVATGQVNSRNAVRVLATDERVGDEGGRAAEAEMAPRDTLPVGHAHFVSDEPMSIENDHSAMVSMLNEITEAKRVYFFDPVSQRGSKKYAFNAVRIKNPSPYTLDAGPFTIYAAGQFLGEGLSEAILPKSTAFIPYALDRSIVADPLVDTREEIERLLTIQRGVVTSETRRIRRTKLTLSNRGKQPANVYVRHKVASGFKLTKKSAAATTRVEKLRGAHLFRVDVPASEAVELVIEEWTPLMKTVDIRTDRGVRDISLFLRKRELEPALKSKLAAIIKSHTEGANLRERIDVLDEQMRVYRTRVDEINVQLVTLRKVPQAGRLRRHLATKMEEISNRLQQSTLQVTELKGQLMTLRIELQDKLAELTLKRKDNGDDSEPLATN